MLGIHTFWYYAILLRVIEFIETIFFVLRKKHNQVTFLHIYHHISTIVIFWVFLKYSGGEFSTLRITAFDYLFISHRHDRYLSRHTQLSRSYFHVHLLPSQLGEHYKENHGNGETFRHHPPVDSIFHHHRSLFGCNSPIV